MDRDSTKNREISGECKRKMICLLGPMRREKVKIKKSIGTGKPEHGS